MITSVVLMIAALAIVLFAFAALQRAETQRAEARLYIRVNDRRQTPRQ